MPTPVDFAAQIAAFAAEQRALIEAECSGFATDKVARIARIAQVKEDFAFFCATYFPHYIKHKSRSQFHQWAFDNLPRLIDVPNGIRQAVVAPRGEAKSTIITQLLSLWCIITERKHMIVIVMDIYEQAVEMLEVIKAELDTNPRLKQDYPRITGEGKVWQAGVIVANNNIKVKVGGSGKKLRGTRHGAHRPDLLILDDLENDENVRSKEQRDKLQKWLNRAALKLGPPDGSMDVVYVGTILHYDSVLNRTRKSPTWRSVRFAAINKWPDRMDLWERWEEQLLNHGRRAADDYYAKYHCAMDAGAVVSWPEVRPLVDLMVERAGDHSAFDSEMQNNPSNSDNSLFANITYWAQEVPEWVYFASLDPSMGKSGKRNDPSAILIGGYNRKTSMLDVVVAEIAKRTPQLIIERVIALQKEYRCMTWAIETVAFQEFFMTELIRKGGRAGVPIPAIGIKPHTDKQLRIESLSPYVGNGQIRLHRSQLTLIEQLTHYPQADHDDGPDALEMLWQLVQTHSVPYEYLDPTNVDDL